MAVRVHFLQMGDTCQTWKIVQTLCPLCLKSWVDGLSDQVAHAADGFDQRGEKLAA